MSTISLPSSFKTSTCSLRLSTSQRVSASPFGGSEQAVDLLNDRWLLSAEIPPRLMADGAWVEAFIGAMRGQTNVTPVYHFARPQPQGTVRGTLTLSSAATQGARSLVVAGCVPATGTVKAGDMFGVGGLLVMAASDCTAVAGVVTIPITNALRVAQSAGAAVTWDKPTFMARLLSTNDVGYAPGMANAVSFDFGEAIL